MTEKSEPGVITTHKRKELYSNFAIQQLPAADAFLGKLYEHQPIQRRE